MRQISQLRVLSAKHHYLIVCIVLQEDTQAADPLLDCLIWLSRHYERPRSSAALTAGLAGYEGKMSSYQFVNAATRAGLSSKLATKENLDTLDIKLFPIVALLKDESACIVTRRAGNDFEIVMPESSDGIIIFSEDELNKLYSGKLLYVQPIADTVEDRSQLFAGHWFWNPLARNWGLYSNLLLASALTNIFALTTPLFIKVVYDRVVPNNALETLTALAVGASIVFVFDFLIRTIRGYFVELAGQRADASMSAAIFEHVMDVQLAARPGKVGVLANRLREFEAVREFFTTATVTALIDVPFVLLYVFVIFLIAGNLAAVPLAATILVISIGLVIHLPLSRLAQRSTQDAENRHALLIDSLTGLETVKLTGAMGRLKGIWNRIASSTARRASRSRLLSQFAINFTVTASQAAGIGIVVLGVLMIGRGDLTAGTLIAVVILNGRAVGSLGQIAGLMVRLNHALSAYRSLNTVMQLPIERPADRNFLNRPKFSGLIEFRHVTFTYPGRNEPVLRDVSFSIPVGASVGLIGRIGSGKTTILRLALKLYTPDEGAVLLDGTDTRQIDPVDLRRNVGAALQDAHFFNGSMRENLVLGLTGIADERIEWATKLAGLNNFIAAHPHGLDMMVGERGEALSNGQRQSVILARTFLRDPPILLLDEPTSMMDSNSESIIQKSIHETFPDRTLMLVTHRASLLKSVEHLLVLDGGALVAEGPRDSVLDAIAEGRVPTLESS